MLAFPMIFKIFATRILKSRKSMPIRKTRLAFARLSNKQQSFYGIIYYRQEDNLMF